MCKLGLTDKVVSTLRTLPDLLSVVPSRRVRGYKGVERFKVLPHEIPNCTEVRVAEASTERTYFVYTQGSGATDRIRAFLEGHKLISS